MDKIPGGIGQALLMMDDTGRVLNHNMTASDRA